MKQVWLIGFWLVSSLNGSGPLHDYNFDGAYKARELAVKRDYQTYLNTLAKDTESGIEFLSGDDGAILGGALLTTNSPAIDSLANRRQLFEAINQCCDNFINLKNTQDEALGIKSATLRDVSRFNSAAGYYQKAVAKNDQPSVVVPQRIIDTSVAQILSGKEGVANRVATPAERTRYIQIIYEQAHRSLERGEALLTGLQRFETTSASVRERSHVASLRAIFCMAWRFHQGDPEWANDAAIKQLVGAPWAAFITLKDLTAELREVFAPYQRFRDRYVDDQAALAFIASKSKPDWQTMTQDQTQAHAWYVAKQSAWHNRDHHWNADWDGGRNDPKWEASNSMLSSDYSTALANLAFIEPIAPDLATYLSQVQRGHLAHESSVIKFLKNFELSAQILKALPEISSAAASPSQGKYGFQSPEILTLLFKNYGNNLELRQNMNLSVVKFLTHAPRVELGDPRDSGYLTQVCAQNQMLHSLSTQQFQTILATTFKACHLSLESKRMILKKEFSYFNCLDLLLTTHLAPDYDHKVEFCSVKHCTTQAAMQQHVIEPLLAIYQTYKDNDRETRKSHSRISFTNHICGIFQELLSNLPPALMPSPEHLKEIFQMARTEFDSTEPGSPEVVKLLNTMLANDLITSKLPIAAVQNLCKDSLYKFRGILKNPKLDRYVEPAWLETLLGGGHNTHTDLRHFQRMCMASDAAMKLVGPTLRQILGHTLKQISALTQTDAAIDPGIIVSEDGGGILHNPNYLDYIDNGQINAIVDQVWQSRDQARGLDRAALFKEILKSPAAREVNADLLKKIYNLAIATNREQCSMALAIQDYARGQHCLTQRGHAIVLRIRPELTQAAHQNIGVNPMEIHNYTPPQALEAILTEIQTQSAKLNLPKIGEEAVIEFLREKIKLLEESQRSAATDALNQILLSGNGDYKPAFLSVMSRISPWLNSLEGDQAKIWSTYLINSLVEAGQAYDRKNATSCLKGIYERSVLGVKRFKR